MNLGLIRKTLRVKAMEAGKADQRLSPEEIAKHAE